MNINRRNDIDAKMVAALVQSVGIDHQAEEARISKIASTVKSSTMEKTAGIMIDNPTLENCEDFVRRYMLGELALLPQLMEFSVNIIPSGYDSTNEDFLTDATGMVRIKVHSKTIEIPFLIYSGELVPFDIIQMDGQRVPYSRENLVKIISGVKYKEELVQNGGGGESPYVGLAEHYNTSTVPGFMGEVLAIRDTHSHRQGTGSMYVTAGDYEYGFEKKAYDPQELGVAKQSFTEDSRPTGDLLGLGLFSDKRREETEEDKEARKEQKEKDDKADGKEKTASQIYKVDGSNNIIGDHDLIEVGKSSSGNVLYKNKKGDFYDFYHEGDEVKPITADKAQELYPNLFKKAAILTDLDALLEKVAGINAMTDEQYQAIADVINKKAHEEYKARIEKIASEMPDLDMTRMEKRAMEERVNHKFHTLASFKNGDFILFPEIVNKGISLTPAVVLETSEGKMILTADRRYEMVKDAGKFICTAAPTEFKVKMSSVDSLTEGDEFILLVGDKAEPLNTVDRVRHYMKADNLWDTTTEKELPKNLAKFIYYMPSSKDEMAMKAFCVLDVPAPVKVTRDECTELVAKENLMPENEIKKYVHPLKHATAEITAVPPKTPIIKVGGGITSRIDSNKQYEELMKLASAGYEIELGTEKLAFALNTVTIKCLNPRTKIFDLSVEYKDTSARMLAKRRKDFKAISVGKLKAILYMLKFDGQTINDIIYKAKNEPQAQYPLPQACTQDDINAVFGGNETNVSKETIKSTIGQFVNPYTLARGVASATGVALLANAAANQITKGGVSGQALQRAFDFVGKVADQSAELSAEFEKIAIDKESYIHQDYAKVFAMGSLFCEKVAHAMKDESNHYPSLKDVSSDILAAKPVLEKFAYEITKEKVNALVGQNNANMEVLASAVGTLDKFYKIAYEINQAIDFSEMKLM